MVQFAVPTVALVQDPPTRFGFQMYSGYSGSIVVLDDDGEVLEIDLLEHFTKMPRTELDWHNHVPGWLCTRVERADAIMITQGRNPSKVIPCKQ
jgi:hypothetical protein